MVKKPHAPDESDTSVYVYLVLNARPETGDPEPRVFDITARASRELRGGYQRVLQREQRRCSKDDRVHSVYVSSVKSLSAIRLHCFSLPLASFV